MEINQITISQLLVMATLPVCVVLIIHEFTKRRLWKFLNVYSFIAIAALAMIIVFSECSMKPFSKHGCFCEGYRDASGSYPIFCKHK